MPHSSEYQAVRENYFDTGFVKILSENQIHSLDGVKINGWEAKLPMYSFRELTLEVNSIPGKITLPWEISTGLDKITSFATQRI